MSSFLGVRRPLGLPVIALLTPQLELALESSSQQFRIEKFVRISRQAVLARVNPSHRPAVARNRPLVIKIEFAMRRNCFRRESDSFGRDTGKPPRSQKLRQFQKEIPVENWIIVL